MTSRTRQLIQESKARTAQYRAQTAILGEYSKVVRGLTAEAQALSASAS